MLVPAFIIRLCPTHIAPFFYSRYSAVKNSIYIRIPLSHYVAGAGSIVRPWLLPSASCGVMPRTHHSFCVRVAFFLRLFYKQLHSRAHVDACALICTHVLHTHCIY
ncbi:expressed protein [Echinococcus multilocularis]|uniref:Expressed protein n=1 Tax=Echinococcus multilocularis TaxID=6211 RepID=A0A068Y6Y0_ECHMU|nr:expressed protein [Echinococcus multilocularis]